MHVFSIRLGGFIMYCCSIFANSEKWSIFRKSIYSIFILLLSYYKAYQVKLQFEHLLLDFESTHEEKYYQQSKRSMYYKDYLEDFKNAKKNSKTRKTGLEKNNLYCPQLGGCLLNN